MIFGSTTHFIITFTAVISRARARGAANELYITLSSNLLRAAPQRLFRFRAVITTSAGWRGAMLSCDNAVNSAIDTSKCARRQMPDRPSRFFVRRASAESPDEGDPRFTARSSDVPNRNLRASPHGYLTALNADAGTSSPAEWPIY